MITVAYTLERIIDKAVEAYVERQKAATVLDLTETIHKAQDADVRANAITARRRIAEELNK